MDLSSPKQYVNTITGNCFWVSVRKGKYLRGFRDCNKNTKIGSCIVSVRPKGWRGSWCSLHTVPARDAPAAERRHSRLVQSEDKSQD